MNVNALSTAAIDLNGLREDARRELLRVLDSVPGKKGLVLDPKLAGPLSLIAEYSLLKEHGVERIYMLQAGRLDSDMKNLIYLCRSKMLYMKHISDHIHIHKQDGHKKDYNIFFVPKRTLICEKILEEEGVYAELQIGELDLNLIPFDDDVLSLELDASFRELYLEGDRTSLFYVAKSLMRLQEKFGIIPKIQGKGHCARLVADMMLRMRKEVGKDEKMVAPEIENLILIDRNVDLITPMCSQLTYEGLIDELFGISNTCVELEPAMTGFKEKRKIPLNSGDSIYRELRDNNFSVVGPLLNKSAKRINAEYEERHNAKTVSQIREFVGKLGGIQTEHQSLRIHTNIAEFIMGKTKDADFHRKLEVEQNFVSGIEADANQQYIEELMNKQEPIQKVLRLLCLYSLTSNGLKPKVLDHLKRELLQTYGYEYIFTLNKLEKLGMLKKSDSKTNYGAVRKGFKLVVEDINEKEPEDIAYVYSGYAPLSIRVIQNLMQPTGLKSSSSAQSVLPGFRTMEDVMKLLPGPVVEENQALPSGLQSQKGFANSQSKVTLIFFLGGCTFTELAAIRFLEKQSEGRDFIIATTKMISGNTMLESLFEQAEGKGAS